MLYKLSKIIPVRMRSTYKVQLPEDHEVRDSLGPYGGPDHRGAPWAKAGDWITERATWWQWRSLIWRHQRRVMA